MKLERTEYGALAVLAPKGDLSGDEVESFRREALKCVESGCADLILDCAGVTSLDSEGLEALTALSRCCQEHTGMLKLCGLDNIARKILEMTRLNHQFELFEDVDAAIRSRS